RQVCSKTPSVASFRLHIKFSHRLLLPAVAWTAAGAICVGNCLHGPDEREARRNGQAAGWICSPTRRIQHARARRWGNRWSGGAYERARRHRPEHNLCSTQRTEEKTKSGGTFSLLNTLHTNVPPGLFLTG